MYLIRYKNILPFACANTRVSTLLFIRNIFQLNHLLKKPKLNMKVFIKWINNLIFLTPLSLEKYIFIDKFDAISSQYNTDLHHEWIREAISNCS